MKVLVSLMKSVVTTILTCCALLNAEKMEDVKVEVPLNHFFLVLDSETYKAIEGSAFLKEEFGVFEQRTTVRTDMTYTGLYFYGANTYFEFFDLTQKKESRIGDSGIAFGVDQAGSIQELRKKMSWSEPVTITRQLDRKQVPWFLMSSPKDFPSESGMTTWIMEYLPTFLSEWHPEDQSGPEQIARNAILSRYATFLKEDPSTRLLKDVAGLTIAIDESTKTRLLEYCSAFGYAISKEGDASIAKGPDVTIRFIAQKGPVRGIQQIEFTVRNSPSKRLEYRFGPKSVLKFESSQHATWSF
jgi:hypothetical protein